MAILWTVWWLGDLICRLYTNFRTNESPFIWSREDWTLLTCLDTLHQAMTREGKGHCEIYIFRRRHFMFRDLLAKRYNPPLWMNSFPNIFLDQSLPYKDHQPSSVGGKMSYSRWSYKESIVSTIQLLLSAMSWSRQLGGRQQHAPLICSPSGLIPIPRHSWWYMDMVVIGLAQSFLLSNEVIRVAISLSLG